ncbi:DUF6243 family protein [Streptomyces fuscigenes]|uniref:DUF6243 family protein n=1 Tax=Streptomyces fuscigenes TaxID=1528880 RepID=UPI001F362E31|nr:DUF6243 family protein [Streptomyces fuscigenes]MCF3961887.1 DUF6243 family protein [Streptomyces fuscigenes]
MAKSRNNLLGVGGQRRKLPRSQGQGAAPGSEDRRSAAEQKQDLVRRMRERAGGQASAPQGAGQASAPEGAGRDEPDTASPRGGASAAGEQGPGGSGS